MYRPKTNPKLFVFIFHQFQITSLTMKKYLYLPLHVFFSVVLILVFLWKYISYLVPQTSSKLRGLK